MNSPPRLVSEIFNPVQVSHGFFGRTGGVSTGVYASLNCGPGSGDASAAVTANRELCRAALNADSLTSLYQTHSADAVYTASPFDEPPKADAVVTNVSGLAVGVLTADCLPVLLHDPSAKVIAAAHAGWRGALGGILENTVKLMTEHGAVPSNIVAAMGPCLRQNNFEVGMDLVDAFSNRFDAMDRFFSAGRAPDKRQFDLTAFAAWRLLTAGLESQNIDDVNVCTLAHPEAYFSFRYTKKNDLPDYGRNLSAICLTGS